MSKTQLSDNNRLQTFSRIRPCLTALCRTVEVLKVEAHRSAIRLHTDFATSVMAATYLGLLCTVHISLRSFLPYKAQVNFLEEPINLIYMFIELVNVEMLDFIINIHLLR